MFVMVKFQMLCDRDMNGIYFMQLDGNEDQIMRFKKILLEEIKKKGYYSESVIFYPKKYTETQVDNLKIFEQTLWNLGANDEVQRLKLFGRFQLPEKPLDQGFEEWFEEHFDWTKSPNWTYTWEKVESL